MKYKKKPLSPRPKTITRKKEIGRHWKTCVTGKLNKLSYCKWFRIPRERIKIKTYNEVYFNVKLYTKVKNFAS